MRAWLSPILAPLNACIVQDLPFESWPEESGACSAVARIEWVVQHLMCALQYALAGPFDPASAALMEHKEQTATNQLFGVPGALGPGSYLQLACRYRQVLETATESRVWQPAAICMQEALGPVANKLWITCSTRNVRHVRRASRQRRSAINGLSECCAMPFCTPAGALQSAALRSLCWQPARPGVPASRV